MKLLLANGREPADLAPGDIDPVVCGQVALRAIPAEVRNHASTFLVPPDGTERHERELTLDFWILLAECEKLVKLGWTAPMPRRVECAEHFARRDVAMEMDELNRDIGLAYPLRRKVL